VSFGTFEVDLDSGEIRKAGLRIRLQGQPFRVLAALLAKPGEVVSRERLQHEIWGDKTNIDFERGIAGAINKIRDALGDSAENPRFIETLARRGYRFIAPVVVADVQPAPVRPAALGAASRVAQPPITGPAPPAVSVEEAAPPSPTVPSLSRETVATPATQPRPGNRMVLPAACALVLVALASLATYFLVPRFSGPARPLRIEQLTEWGTICNGPPNDENHLRLVSDGTRIYTSFLVGGQSQLSSMDLGGTDVEPVSLPDELGAVSVADISRDGSQLIVKGQSSRGSEQPLWIVPATGGSALRVGSVLAHDATWMPAGDSILFAAGNTLGIVNLDLDENTETTYATLPGRAFWPRWSPNGRVLRFTLMDPVRHSSSLWELDAASRRARRLDFPALAGMDLCCGSWMPDGRTYVFEAGNLDESNLWSEGRGRLGELTNGPLRFVSPLPGRSGQTVYFVGIEQPAGDRVYDQKQHQFVQSRPYLGDAGKVVFSRDARWVAWTDARGHLWRARSADGLDRLRLTGDDLEVFLAQWSPDGQQLVLMARRPGETYQIYTVGATGGVVHLLLADRRNLADPDWSADGHSIVFGRQAELMGKESGPKLIQIFDLSTRAIRTLPGSENLFSPRWSPDGRSILALSLDQTRLLVYDVRRGAQGGWRTLYSGSVADPVWSSDSKAIFFHSSAKANSGIMRIPLHGAAQLVADPAKMGLPSDDYRFSGITPNGAPIVEPGIGTGNLYSLNLMR
jgi:Tol biopolymer transport system component/DNA-binding winged helix-turn-helix (wHTH) protein